MTKHTPEILLVEDNPGDVELIRTAFDNCKLKSKLNVTYDGDEALDYLSKSGKYEDAATPNIILLDLNLPCTDGRGVLKQLKNNQKLKHIPTIVLSSSQAANDINDAYALNANCYITKPNDAKTYIEVIKAIEHFWSQTCTLPPGDNL